MKKLPPIFHFQGWKSFLFCTFVGKFFPDWQFLGNNLQILGGNSIKIGIFWDKSLPPLIFLPHPPILLFGIIFTCAPPPWAADVPPAGC